MPSVVMLGSIIVQSGGDAAWAALAAALGAVGASAVTGLITYKVTRRLVSAEDLRWNASQEAARRAATADRLRVIYPKMAQAAGTLQTVVIERPFVTSADQDVEARNQRHDAMIKDALNIVSEVGGQIMVESSAGEVRETYPLLVSLVRQYMTAEATMDPGNERSHRLTELTEAIVAMADKLLELANEHLAELDRPVRVGVHTAGG